MSSEPIPEAIEAVFPRTQVQLCIVHKVRGSLKYVPWKERKEVAADLRAVYGAATLTEAEQALERFSARWDGKYPAISPSWRADWQRLTVFFDYPKEIRKVEHLGVKRVTHLVLLFEPEDLAVLLSLLAEDTHVNLVGVDSVLEVAHGHAVAQGIGELLAVVLLYESGVEEILVALDALCFPPYVSPQDPDSAALHPGYMR